MRTGLSEDLIARVLGAAPKYTIAELEQKFPPRDLPDGAMVTRFAPSPTGYMHLGGLYGSLIDCKLA
jgi:glutamyl-tRNA synthetase